MEVYKHSGAVTVSGLALATAAGLAAAGVLGVVYTFLLVYIPFVYGNILGTLAFGFCMGFAVGWGSKVGKIRHGFVTLVLGVAIGLVGLYVAWATDPYARIGGEEATFAFNPSLLKSYMEYGYQNGFWSIGKRGLKNNEMVKGYFLAAVWCLEGAIIVGMAGVVAGAFASTQPFCERCNQWTKATDDVQRLANTNAHSSEVQRLLTGDLGVLADMVRADGQQVYLRLDLSTCEGCNDSNFLTVSKVEHGFDKDKKPTVNTTALLTNLVVSAADVSKVHEAGRVPPEEPSPGDEGQDAGPQEFNIKT